MGRATSSEYAYFDVWITFHDFFDSSKGEGRVSEIGCLLFCRIDLSLPEGTEEFIEGIARLDEGLRIGGGHRGNCSSRVGRLTLTLGIGISVPMAEVNFNNK